MKVEQKGHLKAEEISEGAVRGDRIQKKERSMWASSKGALSPSSEKTRSSAGKPSEGENQQQGPRAKGTTISIANGWGKGTEKRTGKIRAARRPRRKEESVV